MREEGGGSDVVHGHADSHGMWPDGRACLPRSRTVRGLARRRGSHRLPSPLGDLCAIDQTVNHMKWKTAPNPRRALATSSQGG